MNFLLFTLNMTCTNFTRLHKTVEVIIRKHNHASMHTYTYIHSTIQVVNVVTNWTNYRERGKICWAEHLQFQPYEFFCRNTFTVHWPPVCIIYL